ncbi:MAG: PhoH family protein [Prevotella sp.]|nr:PhoH family protein [Prevotella sp.]
MTERTIILDTIDPIMLYGVNNSRLALVRSFFPKLRLTARGNVVRMYGSAPELSAAYAAIESIVRHIEEYNTISDADIANIINNRATEQEVSPGALLYTTAGKAIKARGIHQQQLVDSYAKNDLLIAVGPAGTGKTYLSIALAVRSLKTKQARRIILSRPAVEAGEKLGFLPGDMRDKIDPYLRPLYDALEDMLPQAKLQDLIEKDVIQIAPLAFMRGRTLNDAVVILDEAQNTTRAQLRMFLTRLGTNSKMIITGDLPQIDLPDARRSGLREAVGILGGIEGIAIVGLGREDIVRHPLVTRIVDAYAGIDKTNREQE